MAKKNLALDGAPKRLTPIIIKNSQFHMSNGQLIAGISKTQAANPLDDSKLVTSPTKEKNLAPVNITPGMRRR